MDALIERVRDVSSSSSEKNNKMRDEASLYGVLLRCTVPTDGSIPGVYYRYSIPVYSTTVVLRYCRSIYYELEELCYIHNTEMLHISHIYLTVI